MGSGPLKGCSYELHSSSYDKANQTTLFFGTFTATHNSDGGPVEPTGKQTVTDYVYALTMDEAGNVSKMYKFGTRRGASRSLAGLRNFALQN